MAFERREYVGGAPETTLDGDLSVGSDTLLLTSGIGYPGGAVGPFVIVIDPGLVGEEKILCSNLTGNTITVVGSGTGRGYDDTADSAHSSGAVINHVATARDLNEANQHYSDTGLDHHTQYLDNTRHDIEGRHTFTAAFGTPDTPDPVGTAAAIGTGDNPAKEDHVHDLGTGSIDASNLFAAGVVDAAALATNSVNTAELVADSVTNVKMADDSVNSAEIADGAIDTVHIADLQVTRGKLETTLMPVISCTAATRPGTPAEGQEIWETDTDRNYVWESSAWQPRRISAFAFAGRSDTQIAIPANNWTTASCAQLYDPGNRYDGTEYDAPVTGFYHFDGAVSIVGVDDNFYYRTTLALWKNGQEWIRGTDWYYSTSAKINTDFTVIGAGVSWRPTVSASGLLNAGDTVSIRIWQNSTSNAPDNFHNRVFSGFFVGR